MLRFAIAGGVLALAATPAFAQFYIVQSKTDKTCKIVETKPADTTTVVIVGDKTFTTREEAEKQIKVVCKPAQ